MKNTKRRRYWLTTTGLSILIASLSWADATPTKGNPDTNAADRNYDQKQPNSVPGYTEKARDAGDRGLNKVDAGVHKGIHKTKKGAKKTWDKATQPANKPAPAQK